MYLGFLSIFALLVVHCSALALPPRAHSYPHHVLYQFPNGTWVENIAVRANNEMLVTLLTAPSVYSLDPNSAHPSPKVVQSFPPSLGVLGITEVEPDHFYVITTNFSMATGNPGFGQGGVHSLIFCPDGSITTSQIALFPKAELLNGMSTLSVSQGLVVLSDTFLGSIWLLNIYTGETRILLSAPELAPPPNITGALGINGIRVHYSPENNETATIFFANDGTSTVYSVSISLTTLSQTGPIVPIKSGISIDDFAVSAEGKKLYLAASTENEAVELDVGTGDTEILLGGLNNTILPGPTSAALSRRGKRKVFYTTSGGVLSPVDGTYSEGGKVVVIDVD